MLAAIRNAFVDIASSARLIAKKSLSSKGNSGAGREVLRPEGKESLALGVVMTAGCGVHAEQPYARIQSRVTICVGP